MNKMLDLKDLSWQNLQENSSGTLLPVLPLTSLEVPCLLKLELGLWTEDLELIFLSVILTASLLYV